MGDCRATLAQLVERLIRNQQVASSILAGGSRRSRGIEKRPAQAAFVFRKWRMAGSCAA